jgi:uncharacterized protein YgiM (DUF1202 family)
MKKIIMLIMCLALMSLACLESAAVVNQPSAVSGDVVTATAVESIVPTVTKGLDTPAATRPAKVSCAKVIASDALNLRMQASEQSRILAWLKNNDVVVVVDTSNADWWFVQSAVLSGYVRSVYLQKSECVK